MQFVKRVFLLAFVLLFGCQPSAPTRVILIVDGQTRGASFGDGIPTGIFAQAGLSVSAADRVLVNGIPQPIDQSIPASVMATLQLRPALTITLVAPNGQVTLNSAAATVGEAILEAGITLSARDRVNPPPDSSIRAGMTITITPAVVFNITTGGNTFITRSAATTVGQALAEAGIPLMGLDQSTPSESDALPSDGQIRVVRVNESTKTTLKVIPYEIQLIVTTELAPPLQDVLEAGRIGLALNRTRTRYEDGAEVSRNIESETIIQLPLARVVRSSYWAAKEMYATSYSPCRSGVDACLNGTSHGLPVTRGVVAMYYDWYIALGGERVYIPGYGEAIIADVGGGFPDDRPWIDLGFSDADYEEWSGWVTVYFLAPAPATIPWFLQ